MAKDRRRHREEHVIKTGVFLFTVPGKYTYKVHTRCRCRNLSRACLLEKLFTLDVPGYLPGYLPRYDQHNQVGTRVHYIFLTIRRTGKKVKLKILTFFFGVPADFLHRGK